MKCLNCGDEFAPLSINQKYCCGKCGESYRRKHQMDKFYPSITFS